MLETVLYYGNNLSINLRLFPFLATKVAFVDIMLPITRLLKTSPI